MTLVSYYGGKQRIAKEIIKLFPPHITYIEPFAGGLGVLYNKPVLNIPGYSEAINDKLELLINLYRVAQGSETQPQLIELINGTLYSQSEHTKSKEMVQNPESHSPVELAWAMFVNLNQSFSNIINGGWSYVRVEGNTKRSISFQNKIEDLNHLCDRLEDVQIHCEDAVKMIDRYDNPATLIFCDPPYVGANQGHYGGYTEDDFQALIDKLDGCKSSFIMSCYPNDQCPSHWGLHEVKAKVTAANAANTKPRDSIECLYYMDRSDNIDTKMKKRLGVHFSQMNLF